MVWAAFGYDVADGADDMQNESQHVSCVECRGLREQDGPADCGA